MLQQRGSRRLGEMMSIVLLSVGVLGCGARCPLDGEPVPSEDDGKAEPLDPPPPRPDDTGSLGGASETAGSGGGHDATGPSTPQTPQEPSGSHAEDSTDGCGTDEGLWAQLALDERGEVLPDDHRCVARPMHFRGLVLVGSLAHDRGCMRQLTLLDCEIQDEPPSARTMLARAGWVDADPEARAKLALAYIDEVETKWRGSVVRDPEPKVVTTPRGGVRIVAWIARPSGRRRGHREDRIRYTFAPNGKLSQTTVAHREVGR